MDSEVKDLAVAESKVIEWSDFRLHSNIDDRIFSNITYQKKL